jgi:pilus assembly protein CpaE
MRVLIASDDPRTAQRVREGLQRNGQECPPGHIVPLDVTADRSGQLLPELVVFVLPPEPLAGLQALRDTRTLVPNTRALVVGPAGDPKLILEALKQGADEFLDQEILESELNGSFARSRGRESLSEIRTTGGRVVAILAPSGGSGASTLAASLSVVLAQQHGECGLLDLRLGAGDLAAMLDMRPAYTLADLCDHLNHLDQTLFETVLVRHASGVHLVAAPMQLSDARRVTTKGVRRAVGLARTRFPMVLVDAGTVLGPEQLEALWQADAIVLVLRLDLNSLRNARQIRDTLVELGIGADRLRLVVNGCRQRGQVDREQVEESLGMKVTGSIPYDPRAANAAINAGMPVVLQQRHGPLARSIRRLAACLQTPHGLASGNGKNGHSRRGFWNGLATLAGRSLGIQ